MTIDLKAIDLKAIDLKTIDSKTIENFILIYKLSIKVQISLIIGNFCSAGLITGISSEKRMKENC